MFSRSHPVGGRQDEVRSAVRRVPMSDQPTSVTAALPMADILPLVLQYLSKDLASLCACALVDRSSNRAASAVLYRHIVFAPPWTTALDLNEARKYSVRSSTQLWSVRWALTTSEPRSVLQQPGSVLCSAALPHYAVYVKTVEIGGTAVSR